MRKIILLILLAVVVSGCSIKQESKQGEGDGQKNNINQNTTNILKSTPKNLSGENSASWKGGLTPKNALIRASAEYHQWRMDVVTRDNFKCKRCGETGGEIHAHHILSFSKHPELRFDINNGITLCDKCNSEIHGHNVSIKHLKKAEIA